MSIFEGISLQGVLAATVRMAAPLLFASLGGLFSARVGIINLALEGFMLVGALTGFLGSVYTGNVYLGALFGMMGGMSAAMILAFLAITAKANQTVAGVGINIFALGLTSYLLTVLFGFNRPYGVATFAQQAIPGLSKIPFIGPILFQHSVIVYFAFILVPIVWYVMYKTPAGLMIRATGENPKAVDTLGGNVTKIRYICMLISGGLAGLGGAALSIGQMGQFMENITAGKGYIALATLIFGKFTPIGSLLASLLFGFSEGLQLRLQTAGSVIPYQFLSMLPYIITLIALTAFARKFTGPASLGKPYNRQG
ncbi:MAG: ABC transporter permease [Clostridia bacterium]